jgi:uncharacterized membrane protein YeiH
MWDLFYFLDLAGTFVFAISGALSGIDKKYDIFGVLFIAFITAIGGGTTRDLLLGLTPVTWMNNLIYLYIIVTAVIITFFTSSIIMKLRKTLFLFDSIGLGVFTIAGIKKTIDLGLSWEIAIMMGVISATMGGILRDVFNNEKPLILQKEIYATACFTGGLLLLFFYYHGLDTAINAAISIAVITIIRILAVKYQWSLPVLISKKQ